MKKMLKCLALVVAFILGMGLSFVLAGNTKLKNYISDSRVFVTGNIHGKINFDKLNEHNFPLQKDLSEEDNLIILGDFGLVWDNHIEDEILLDVLDEKKFNILFVDGTRENFELLDTYEEVELYGGKARKIRDNIFHLMRGEVYTIGKKDYLVMGGGISYDAEMRTEGVDYWKNEKPSSKDWDNLNKNLGRVNNRVDYVLTHTPPGKDLRIIGAQLGKNLGVGSILNQELQDLSNNIKYKKWFHSEYHLDTEISRKHSSIFNQIIEIK